VNVDVLPQSAEAADPGIRWRFSTGLHNPESDLRYADPQPALFSFNSAYGACETCRGFGRVIGVDWGLVIPDERKTCAAARSRPCRRPPGRSAGRPDAYAAKAGIPRDTAWNMLTQPQREWVIDGSPDWNGKWQSHWYGVKRFFEYLESKAYKMHIRVLLSKYRSYTPCEVCDGARLKTEGAAVAHRHEGATPTPCCRRCSATCRTAWTGRARSSKRCRA
jgi:excinuclease ABC subunit A